MPKVRRHAGVFDGLDAQQVVVGVGEHFGNVGLGARVDGLVEGAEDDLAEVKATGVGLPRSDQLVQQVLWDRAPVLEMDNPT